MRTILGVLVSALLVAGCAGATGTAAPSASAPAPSSPASASPSPTQASAPASVASVGASPGSSGALGVVHYQIDGSPATTEVKLVADGASVSGQAVTTFREGVHTVQVGCAIRSGDTWALGGKIEQTTVPGETAGNWSAVIVKDSSPQQIGIWFSDDAATASDCQTWLASIDVASIGIENFHPVESGSLVPPA